MPWEVTMCNARDEPKCRSGECTSSRPLCRRDQLLADGWEPYAACAETLYLRRFVSGPMVIEGGKVKDLSKPNLKPKLVSHSEHSEPV